ncbi:AMP-dependent synthetase/ligase [Halapricum salinum]|uniref:Long-chain fatty acid--CoA ligase n=1 Tax=Halapricum salinum TaxID=1457250 RepID=A0A4D6HFY8_9EURY|nr:long-chain fatty acid--CoA ligase [Halapricum salinum]QCC52700.1 long-chain fatty acid--CoA ligase [Halapricum salinum]
MTGGFSLAEEQGYNDEIIGDDTLPAMFEATVERNKNRNAQRFKVGVYDRSLPELPTEGVESGTYRSITYGEMQSFVHNLAAGFRELGVGGGDRVGIYGSTRMEWALSDFALLAAGGVVTTVYTESSPRQVRYLLDDPGATGVVVENQELLDTLLEVEDDLDLEFIVAIDEVDSDHEAVYTLGEVHEMGAEAFDIETYQSWIDARDREDLATLIYTSGTTDEPKGVELTHWNIRSNVNQNRKRMAERPDKPAGVPALEPGIDTISFLPLAHVFERTAGHFLMFASGACVGYAESTDTIAEDIQQLQPQVGASVPRIYERIFDSMRESAGGGLKGSIFSWAIDVAKQYARAENPGAGLRFKHSLADRLVYSTVKERLGGNIEFMVSGGGSLSKDLAELFLGLGIPILEGYGLTETAPVVSVNPPEDIRPGTLGPPVTDVETKIDTSVVGPEQFTDADGEVGELLLKGPNVFERYWNKPDATERVFTEDGWFRTGDVIEQTADGYLTYRDRIKQILVLDTGKNIAPGPIEDEFATSDRVEQIMVVGDGQKFVSALVVPNFEQVRQWADSEGIDLPDDQRAICQDDRVHEWIDEEIQSVNADLEKAARIKQFRLVSDEWTADNNLLTPSMKKKRRSILDRFADDIDEIYGDS